MVLFVGFGYYYLKSQDIKTQNQIEKVPYYSQIPENKGVLLSFGSENVYSYLDFENMRTTIILDYEEIKYTNYHVDYKMDADYELIADICDYFGGVNLLIEAETLRYTGSQVLELLKRDNSKEMRGLILTAVFEKMAQQGTGADFFNMLISKSKTNMKMPDCYFWTDFMCHIAKNIAYN